MTKKKSKWIGMLIQMLCGAIFGVVASTVFINSSNGDMGIIDFIILLTMLGVAAFLQLIIHEGGHLLFGLLSGYSFISFRIASFIWVKENNHIVFKRFSMVGTGGQCLLAPPPYQDDNFPVILYNLGGCLLNLIVSFICIIFYFLFPNITLLSTLLISLTIIGIFYAMMNGIPLQLGGINNDGFNALNTNKDPLTKKVFWLTLKINELNTQNIRLKDMSDDLFLDLEVNEIHNNLTTSLLVMNFQRAMDQQDFNKAESILHFINDNNIPIMGIHQNILTNDQIYCLLISHNFNNIESFYTKPFIQFIKAMKKTPSIIRTQYTYELLYNKDDKKAQDFLDYFNEVIKTYPYQCDIDSEKELIDYAYHIYKQENI